MRKTKSKWVSNDIPSDPESLRNPEQSQRRAVSFLETILQKQVLCKEGAKKQKATLCKGRSRKGKGEKQEHRKKSKRKTAREGKSIRKMPKENE